MGKSPLRISYLTTVGGVASELAKVYRQARREQLDITLASKLAGILAILRQVLETADVEKRLALIEEAVNKYNNTQAAFKPRVIK
jgi:hypothetical protein